VTPEIRIDCSDEQKFSLVESVRNRLHAIAKTQNLETSALPIRKIISTDGIRVCFDEGWGLIRASNTQPALVLRFEASSQDHLSRIKNYLERQLSDITNGLIA
jgi:phosphomannomutase / phosphoglucomutase